VNHEPLRAKLLDIRLYRRVARTRFPFRFGKASMTEMPIVYLRAGWEDAGGRTFEGISASGIPPLWFDKRDGKTAADNERDLLASVRAAAAAYVAEGAGAAWDLHRAVTPSVRRALSSGGMAPLAAGFGPALLEAALVDGLCRATGQSFFQALTKGSLGVPSAILRVLPGQPVDFMSLRHTVGLADPLTADDVAAPLRDGLPETLQEVVDVYRPSFFKVKISGNPDETLPRLRRIAAVLETSRAPSGYAITLDGNEQFAAMDGFAEFLDVMRRDAALANFLDKVIWIEQPVRRDAALDPASAAAVAEVSAFRPVILDESDGEEDALERGLALGYGGVSSKTCKGLFRSLSHKLRLAEQGDAAGAGRKDQAALILSCEDLTTVPVHPVQQDLCLAAALGLTHAERNGHHYIRPADFMSARECDAAVEAAPSLYANSTKGPHIHIVDGGFHLDEVNKAHGLGTNLQPDWSILERLG
jgi:hypothetical protein